MALTMEGKTKQRIAEREKLWVDFVSTFNASAFESYDERRLPKIVMDTYDTNQREVELTRTTLDSWMVQAFLQ